MNVIAFMQSTSAGEVIFSILPLIVIVGIFYIFVIGPANKQRKKTEEMLSALKKGDRVVTSGGIYGTIQNVEKDHVQLRIADNVKVKVSRAAITGLVNDAE